MSHIRTHRQHLRCWFTLDSLSDKLLSCSSQVHNATVCLCVCVCFTTSLTHTSLWEDKHCEKTEDAPEETQVRRTNVDTHACRQILYVPSVVMFTLE